MNTTSFDVREVHLSTMYAENCLTVLTYFSLGIPLQVKSVCVVLGTNDGVTSLLGGRLSESYRTPVVGSTTLCNSNRLWQ